MKKILFVLSLFVLWENHATAANNSCTTQSDCKNGFTCLTPLWEGLPPETGLKYCVKICSTNADCGPLKDYLGCKTSWVCESGACRCSEPPALKTKPKT